jgi:hypothetical protein
VNENIYYVMQFLKPELDKINGYLSELDTKLIAIEQRLQYLETKNCVVVEEAVTEALDKFWRSPIPQWVPEYAEVVDNNGNVNVTVINGSK